MPLNCLKLKCMKNYLCGTLKFHITSYNVVWKRNLMYSLRQSCDKFVFGKCKCGRHVQGGLNNMSIGLRFTQTSTITRAKYDENSRSDSYTLELNGKGPNSRRNKVWGLREKEWLTEFVTSTNSGLSVGQWKQVKMNALAEGLFKVGTFESRVMLTCSKLRNFSLAKSLMHFIDEENMTPHIVTLSKYLRLCGDCEGEASEKQIMTTFHRITDNHSLFDSSTAEDIIHGLCRTSSWKESFRFLDMVKQTCLFPNSSCLHPIVVAAFRNGDYESGWTLMNELVLGDQGSILNDAIMCWIDQFNHADEVLVSQMMDKLLAFLNSHEVIVSKEVATNIKYWFERRLNSEWTGSFTRITKSGVCQTCKSKLESIILPNGEFTELRDCFIERVIKGPDMFLKSTPAEISRFLNFVENTAPYSMVLDGLNVAYNMHVRRATHFELAANLLKVVRRFSDYRRKMLILGKQHMENWPLDILKTIKKDAYIFRVENVSEDDPFLLYAAMYSGQGTKFLSKDLMRDHSYCLGDERLKSLFRKWQRGHHIELLSTTADVHFKAPIEYNPVTQGDEERWHIPYRDDITNNTHPISWLCLKGGNKSRQLTKVVFHKLYR